MQYVNTCFARLAQGVSFPEKLLLWIFPKTLIIVIIFQVVKTILEEIVRLSSEENSLTNFSV